MTAFAGWSMPLHYGSQIAEHRAVRQSAGMFDVSHMAITDVAGRDALAFLRRVFANDPAKATPGKAVYGALLNAAGGVIDDLIVYGGDDHWRLVTNAATRRSVLEWLESQAAPYAVALAPREDLAMIAVQGPKALTVLHRATGIDAASTRRFATLRRDEWLIARTGYTGEDGVEIMLPGRQAGEVWQRLGDAGVQPAGLAARDTLRLEAGLNLYGQDMDETTTPLESNLGWTVAWAPQTRAFVGREALERQRAEKPARALQGIVLDGRGVMREGNRVRTNAGEGVVTSGTFSPTLGYSIGLVRVPRGSAGECTVELRGKAASAHLVKPPFLQRGKQNTK